MSIDPSLHSGGVRAAGGVVLTACPLPGGGTGLLFGRRDDVSLVEEFVRTSCSAGGTLLLSGEPGAGKTALLDVAAATGETAGMRVLRAAGGEFEAELGFSALNQLLLGLRDEFGRLGGAQREALEIALGFASGSAPGRLRVCGATLALLTGVAAVQPVLMVVDDLPWVDRASASVLGFVARRLAGSRVGLVAAARAGERSFFDRAGLREHSVMPLAEDAADALLRARFPELAGRVRDRVLAEACGNPLALLELSGALSGSQRSAAVPLPAVLPLTDRLRGLFGAQLRELAADPRRLLLLAALDGTGNLAVVDAAGAGGYAALADLESRGIVAVGHGAPRLVFRHPLVRAAAVELATAQERQRAHRVLAGLAASPERRAWHLAEAAVLPDEPVAALLEAAAGGSASRGDAVGAVNALIRAAELSPLPREKSRRLALAAYLGANVTGELHNVPRLLADARRADPGTAGSLQAAVAAAFLLLNSDGDVDAAHRLLAGAIDAVPDPVSVRAAFTEAVHMLRQVCFVGGRPELWGAYYAAVSRLARQDAPDVYLLSAMTVDPVRTAGGALAELGEAIAGLAAEDDPNRITRVALAAAFVDRIGECREALWRVVRDGRDGGAVTSCIGALMHLGLSGYWSGQWDEAASLVEEGLELATRHGYRLLASYGQTVRACLAASRGDEDTLERVTDELMQWALPRGVRSMHWYVAHSLGLAAIGRGDFEEAYQQAVSVTPPGTFRPGVRYALFTPLDLVESAMRTGHEEQARAHVAAMRAAGLQTLSPRLALVTAGAEAMAARGDGALELFGRAVGQPDSDRWPFDLARVRLAYGEALRRSQAPGRAREQLAAALAAFRRLGAAPWASRCAGELRATGQTRPAWSSPSALTPQEREIAMLAATGLTNKEIGRRLSLSPRTVSGHLYRAFPKLGISSRAALRDALPDPGAGPGAS